MNLEKSFEKLFEKIVEKHMFRLEDLMENIPTRTITQMQGFKDTKEELEKQEKLVNRKRKRLDNREQELQNREFELEEQQKNYKKTLEMKDSLEQGLVNLRKQESWLKKKHPKIWKEYQSYSEQLTQPYNSIELSGVTTNEEELELFSLSLDLSNDETTDGKHSKCSTKNNENDENDESDGEESEEDEESYIIDFQTN
jgi:small-conductance mechanosensitive channel